jgi:hypothetical protein
MTSEKIEEELRMIRKDLDYIKEHMIDTDSFLTENEAKELDESLERFRKGKATKLEDFEKEMG